MKLSVETITPNAAESILLRSASQRQRRLNVRRVNMLARAIKDGQWKVTHQPIAIDHDGVLIDGQHRIAAIAQAGLNVEVLVARDVDPDTFDVIDTGASRSPAATLQIAGYSNTIVVAAAARYALTYQLIQDTKRIPSADVRSAFTPNDLLRYLDTVAGERLLNAIGPANAIGGALGRTGITTWLAASISLLDGVNPDANLRSEFLEKFESGSMLEAGSPILAFRRWITSETGYTRAPRGAGAGFMGMAIFAKSWNAWLDGEPIQTAYFRTGSEIFPRLNRRRATLDLVSA